MKPLNICVVTSTYPRSEADYAVPWMRESIRHLKERGHEVSVLAPSHKGLRDHTIDGVPVHRFRYAPAALENLTHEEGAPNKVKGLCSQLLGIPYIIGGMMHAAGMAARPFDIVHAHWPFPHEPIGSVLAGLCGAPLILNCHGAEFAIARRKWWVKRWLRHSLRKGDTIVANSSDTARQVFDLSGREAMVIPYGSTVPEVDTEHIQGAIPRLLFTGRLIERKGVEYLIRAIPQLLTRRKLEVAITGNGDQRLLLEGLVKSLKLESVVKFLGFVSPEQLAEEYARCDVWVNPAIVDSRGDTEGLGVGAIDAYAHSKPVVCSAVGGIPDAVINRQTGILVPEKNEVALAAAINELLDQPVWAAKLGRQGKEFARKHFSWERVTDELEHCYCEAIDRLRADRTVSIPVSMQKA